MVCLNGKAHRIISGKDFYAMLHAHPMVHGSLFTYTGHGMHDTDCFHCPATHRCPVTKQCREYLYACADVTHLTMAEFNKTCTSPTTKLWLMYMDMVMILKRYIHAERAGLWEEYLAELENMLLYLLADGRCKYVSLENTYNRDVNTKLSTGICHQPATMVKYWRALTVLTAESEQTKAMPHLDLNDTKHHEDTNRQSEKRV